MSMFKRFFFTTESTESTEDTEQREKDTKFPSSSAISVISVVKSFFLILVMVGCSKPAPVQKQNPAVSVTTPIQCDAPIFMDYIGHIEPIVKVDVESQVAGVIIKKHFVDGQDVKKGDLLFTIDPRPYQAALDKAKGVLTQNLASLNLAEETVQRFTKLVKDEYVSQLNYDQYVTNVLTNEAVIKQNVADLDIAKINLEYTFIKAPMDARTGYTKIDPGNYVQAIGTNAGSTNPIVTLTQMTPIYVSYYVPEKDLPSIREANKLGPLKTFVFLTQDHKDPIAGEMILIDNQVDETTGTILLQSTFSNENRRLWPGEFVPVRLITGVIDDAVLIPARAVQFGQKGPSIYILKPDQTVEQRFVTLGQRIDDNIVISSGLKLDEIVILEGQLNLSNGTKVQVK